MIALTLPFVKAYCGPFYLALNAFTKIGRATISELCSLLDPVL